MVPFFQVECPKCGTKNKSGARFCGSCGVSLPGSELKCNSCGATVAANKSFCGNCGKPLSESAAPQITGNRWARRTNDFATKVEVDDVEGFFKRGLIVEAGTKAIFFVNGAYSGILEPGRYDMGGLLQRIKNIFNYKTTTAVLVDTGDAELEFSFSGLPTRDPLRLQVECRLVVQMENPTQFFENMMKGRQNYSLSEMKTFLEVELQNCLQEFIGTKSVEELKTDLSFKQQMEQGVAQHLAATFSRKGISFVQVRVFNFRHPRTDAMTKQKEEYWLHSQELQTTLEGEGSTIGLDRKLMDQEIAKQLMQLEVYEERAKVFKRMQQAVSSNDMDQVKNEVDLEKFMQSVDKDRLLRAEDMRALTQDFAEKKEDRQTARKHLLQRLEIEQNADLARAQLAGKIGVQRTMSDAARAEEMAQLDHVLEAKQKDAAASQALEWADIKKQIDIRTAQVAAELKLRQQAAEVEGGISAQKRAADLKDKVDSKTADIQLDGMEAKSGLDILQQLKEIKAREAEQNLNRGLRERETESEIKMREAAQQHQQDLARIQVLSTLSTEALIAAAPADRASMLAELKRTEGMKGLTEEQILAMAAEKNPEVAKAFQEKFKNASSADVAKAYERMLAMKDQGTADIKEMSREYAKMMQEMYNRGMDTQRDTATAAARSFQPKPDNIIVTSGSGVVHTTGSEGSTPGIRTIGCPQCHVQVEEGHKFCDTCGFKLYG